MDKPHRDMELSTFQPWFRSEKECLKRLFNFGVIACSGWVGCVFIIVKGPTRPGRNSQEAGVSLALAQKDSDTCCKLRGGKFPRQKEILYLK